MKHSFVIPFFALLLTTTLWAQPKTFEFVPAGTFFARPQELGFDYGGPLTLRYTLDGATPTDRSEQYTGRAIRLKTTTVVRAALFDEEGRRVGHVRGKTYLIDEPKSELLTLSVGVDPWRLFNRVNGWFRAGPGADPGHWKKPGANFWTHKEHPAHFEFVTPQGTSVYSSTAGFRMFGGMSRLHPRKSFSFSARKKYGDHRLRYPLFGEAGQDRFKFLVVRNGGSDGGRGEIRDALLTGLLRDQSWNLDHQEARPIRVYLNGRYWGLYHLREKINAKFLADRHPGVDKDELDLLEHERTVKSGSATAYDDLLQFLRSRDRALSPTDYRELANRIDVDNFQRLQIAQTFFANRDAGGNIRYWKPHHPGAKWRWILYDVDQGFGLHSGDAWHHETLNFLTEANGPPWPNPPWSTFLQRLLLTHPDYRRNFVNRSLDYLHTDFATETVLAALDRKVAAVEPEMSRHLKRWNAKEKHWRVHLQRIRDFATRRPNFLREHYRQFFGLGPDRSVRLTAETGGFVLLNDNLFIGADDFSGRYFADLPLTVEATPILGYRFLGWSGLDESSSRLTVDLSQDRPYNLRAKFVPAEHPAADQVIINEISPRKARAGDWLEIHNRGEEELDLTGWILADARDQRFVLPTTTLGAGGYLVVCRDEEAFRAVHPNVFSLVGGLSFGLGKTGDRIGLYGPDGATVNVVTYASETVDTAFTLALALPGLDNTTARHWVTEAGLGTPGAANPNHLKTAVVSRQSFWLRIGIGVAVLLLLILFGGRYRNSTEVPASD